MTNYEHIKQMSIDEMVEFIYDLETEPMRYCKYKHPSMCKEAFVCDDCRVRWLERQYDKDNI